MELGLHRRPGALLWPTGDTVSHRRGNLGYCHGLLVLHHLFLFYSTIQGPLCGSLDSEPLSSELPSPVLYHVPCCMLTCKEMLGPFNHANRPGKRSLPGLFYRTRRDSRQTPKSSSTLSSTVTFLAFPLVFTQLLMSPVHQDGGWVYLRDHLLGLCEVLVRFLRTTEANLSAFSPIHNTLPFSCLSTFVHGMTFCFNPSRDTSKIQELSGVSNPCPPWALQPTVSCCPTVLSSCLAWNHSVRDRSPVHDVQYRLSEVGVDNLWYKVMELVFVCLVNFRCQISPLSCFLCKFSASNTFLCV